MERDPRKGGVEYFVVAGDRLLFLRPRGAAGDVDVGVPGRILSGVLEKSPSGGVQIRDVISGAIVENVRL